LLADRGSDHDTHRRLLWARGIKPVIGRRCTAHGSGLGKQRYVVDQTIAVLHWSVGYATAGRSAPTSTKPS
jgi:transposase